MAAEEREQRNQEWKGSIESEGKQKGIYKGEWGSWVWMVQLKGWR